MLRASLIGNLGNDPEKRYTGDGKAVLRFNVASNFRTRDQSSEWMDKTEWIRCTVFGPRAEKLAEMLHKGTKVYVDGRLEARPWTDNSGQVRAGLEVLADTVEFMSPRDQSDGRGIDGKPVKPLGAGADLDSVPF